MFRPGLLRQFASDSGTQRSGPHSTRYFKNKAGPETVSRITERTARAQLLRPQCRWHSVQTSGVLGPEPQLAVRCVEVTKSFTGKASTITAVDNVSLDIPQGVFFGLVGPNGAGKTTLLRALTGLHAPDSGQVFLSSKPVWPKPELIRPLIGVLPDDLHLLERLSGRELVAYIGMLRRIPPADLQLRTDELLQVLGFTNSADELVADYSTGMRKKIGLAAALIHTPRILFLDEPFESVDPVSVRVLVDVLRAYQRAGGTVVLSSHVMDTVQDLCSHVAVLDQGKILLSGTVDEVRNGDRLEDVFINAVGGNRDSASLAWLDREPVTA
jgi:ABC-2 type transport system ATP-binding protein